MPDIYDDTYAYDLAGYVGAKREGVSCMGDCTTCRTMEPVSVHLGISSFWQKISKA